MKKALIALVAAAGLSACTSVETATVSHKEVAANGEPVAIIQASAIGFTALFHMFDIVQSDLDLVVNKLLVAEAKALGARKIDLKEAATTPRHGIFRLFGYPGINLLGFPLSSGSAIAVK